MALPRLREDLALYPGSADHNGSPTWMLHDPLSNRFYRISWPAFEVLSRWHLHDPNAIVRSIEAETILEVETADVVNVAHFLATNQLVKAENTETIYRMLAIRDGSRPSPFTWLLHHYIFFRLPLVRPDAALKKALPFVTWAGSATFRLATCIALLVGLFLVSRQWDTFMATFADCFSVNGFLGFGIALTCAKVIHECAHALTAKNYGCRVPVMGVAFLVCWPMLYTDANEAWKLTSRRQRLMVGGAGIIAELTLAAWATLVWGVLPEGNLRTVAFTLAATTWISSLIVNLSPFMRFDGYFLVMDALEQPNLHPRSFALARWHLREFLFGLGEAQPEYLPAATRNAMIAFAWMVWIYRLFLFLGIALLVYHFFIKAIAIVLFLVEIGWFIVRPIASEFGQWFNRGAMIGTSGRARLTLVVVCLIITLCIVPWNGRIAAPALLKAGKYTRVYVPSPAILKEVEVMEGQDVAAGRTLVRLDNPDFSIKLEQLEHRIRVIDYELSAAAFHGAFRANTQTLVEELESVIAEKTALINEIQRLTLVAPISGSVTDLSLKLQVGQWINGREPIMGVREGVSLEAYVAEADVLRLLPDAQATFIAEGSTKMENYTIVEIDQSAMNTLAEPSMATLYGGKIPARFSDGSLIPESAFYRVRLIPVDPTAAVGVPLRGRVHILGKRRSLVDRSWRALAAVFIREWG